LSVPLIAAPQRAFLGNVARLGTGQAVALVLPILAAPLLGRLYSPADYGALALFMAATGMLSVVAALQMHHGIIAARSEQAARALVWLCFGLAICLALVLLVALSLASLFNVAVGWLWLLPITVVIAGAMAALTTLANRARRYGFLARLQVSSTAGIVVVSLLCGVLGWGQAGLFAGYLTGQFVTFGFGMHLWRTELPGRRPSPRRMHVVAVRHRRFAQFTLPSELIGSWNQHLPVFALATLGAGPALGAFSRARRLAGLPIALIGASVGQVFRAEAAVALRKTGSCRTLYLNTAVGVFLVGLLPCAALIWAAPAVFTLYLGPQWAEAGQFAQILAPMLLLRLAVSPVSSVFQITGRQKMAFALSLGAAALIGGCVFAAMLSGATALGVIAGFSFAYSLVYCVYFVAGLRVCGP